MIWILFAECVIYPSQCTSKDIKPYVLAYFISAYCVHPGFGKVSNCNCVHRPKVLCRVKLHLSLT
jgi:hypothetical protein